MNKKSITSLMRVRKAIARCAAYRWQAACPAFHAVGKRAVMGFAEGVQV